MARVRLGILFGGLGEEHPVSVKSAVQVAASLDRAAYEPVWIGITRSGAWRVCDRPGADWERGALTSAAVWPDRGVHGVLVLDGGRYRPLRLDAVLPLLHGPFGEDGSVQGLLELAGIPYVGCDVTSSALCLDKALTYAMARAAGVAVPAHRVVTAQDEPDADGFGYPVFVKPARSGSSFGVTKVTRPEDLPGALREARRFGDKVLVEDHVAGSEIGCAVLGEGADLVMGEVDRVQLSHGFFRIHQEDSPERGSDNASFVVPADISPADRDRVRETAAVLYRALGCRGLARVDTFLTPDGRVLLNEVNTMPGLTSYSRYPRMMAAAGLSMTTVIDRLVSMALAAPRPAGGAA